MHKDKVIKSQLHSVCFHQFLMKFDQFVYSECKIIKMDEQFTAYLVGVTYCPANFTLTNSTWRALSTILEEKRNRKRKICRINKWGSLIGNIDDSNGGIYEDSLGTSSTTPSEHFIDRNT